MATQQRSYIRWVEPQPVAEATTPAGDLNAHRARHTATIDIPLDNISSSGLEFIIGSSKGSSGEAHTYPDAAPYPDYLFPDAAGDFAYGIALVTFANFEQYEVWKINLDTQAVVSQTVITGLPAGHDVFDRYAMAWLPDENVILVADQYTSDAAERITAIDVTTSAVRAIGTDYALSAVHDISWQKQDNGTYLLGMWARGEDEIILQRFNPSANTITLVVAKPLVGTHQNWPLHTMLQNGNGLLYYVELIGGEYKLYFLSSTTGNQTPFAPIVSTTGHAPKWILAHRSDDGYYYAGIDVPFGETEYIIKGNITTGVIVGTLTPSGVGSFLGVSNIDGQNCGVNQSLGTYGGRFFMDASAGGNGVLVFNIADFSITQCNTTEINNALTGEPMVTHGASGSGFGAEEGEVPARVFCGASDGLSDPFTLGYWIEQVAEHFLGWTDVDASTLTDTLYGFQSDDISFRRDLEEIREVFDFCIDDHDGTVRCFRAADSGTHDVTLTLADMIPDGNGVYVTTQVAEKDTLPHSVQIEFTDAESLYIRRYAEPAVLQHLPLAPNRIRKFSIPFAMIEKDVKALQWRLLWNLWAASTTFTLTVSAANMDITVGTVVQFPHDETSTYFSAGEVTAADMRADDTQVLTLKGVQVDKAIETTGSPIAFVSLAPTWANQGSQYIHLDIPYQGTFAADIGGTGILEYGIVTSSTAYVWSGGKIYRSDDDGATFVQVHAQASSPFLGTVATPLGAGSPFAGLDDTTTLTIQMLAGSLSDLVDLSIGQAQSGTAKIAYGAPGRWEIIYAATMVHAGSGVVNVTNLYRGMDGSEWAAGLHVAGDFAVLLDMSITAAQEFDVFGLEFDSDSEITTDRQYKGAGSLQSPSAVTPVTRSLTGMSHKSPAPHYLRATLVSGGDIVLEWLRRDRLTDQSDYAELVAPPLSEDLTEVPLVDLDILQSDQTTVIRSKADTLASGTDPEYAITYMAAEISADGDSYVVGDEISFRVRHITTFDNAATLNGHWATVTVLVQAEG